MYRPADVMFEKLTADVWTAEPASAEALEAARQAAANVPHIWFADRYLYLESASVDAVAGAIEDRGFTTIV